MPDPTGAQALAFLASFATVFTLGTLADLAWTRYTDNQQRKQNQP